MSTLKARLESKLRRDPNGCLIFTGATVRGGYGKIYSHSVGTRATGRRTVLLDTHRAAWELAHGPIPDGLFVLHRCDTPACCEPAHLFLGTQADNMLDKSAKGRALPGPSSLPEWWTPELRAARGEWSRARQLAARQDAARQAGVPVDWKRCPTCETWKPLDQFNRNAARDGGYASHCKPCKHGRQLAYRRAKTGRKQRSVTRSDKKFF